MSEVKKKREKVKIEVVFIPNGKDPLETIINAIEPNISLALAKHGASLKIGVKEYLRNHAKR